MKVGDVFKIKAEHELHIEGIKDKVRDFNTMCEIGANGVKEQTKLMWDFIYAAYPELKKYYLSIDPKSNGIVILKEGRDCE